MRLVIAKLKVYLLPINLTIKSLVEIKLELIFTCPSFFFCIKNTVYKDDRITICRTRRSLGKSQAGQEGKKSP